MKTETDELVINEKAKENSRPSLAKLQIVKNMVIIAVPMALSCTFSISQIATAIMATRISKEDPDAWLAATALITTTTNIIIGLSATLMFAMSILASKQEGKVRRPNLEIETLLKAQDRIGAIYKSGMILSTLIAPIPISIMYFSEYLLIHVFRQNPQIAAMVQENLRAYAFGAPLVLYRLCAEQMMFAFNKATPAMLIGWGSLIIGTGLAVFLTFGPPQMGLAGIGYGYLAEAALTCLGYNLYIAGHPVFENIPFFKWSHSVSTIAKQVKKILAMGLPITLQMGCELTANLFTGIFAGWLGKDQLAAQNFSNQLAGFSVLTSFSFGQTVSQEVSRLVGEQDFGNAERVARWGLLTTLAIVSSISTLAAAFPQGLIKILSMSVGPRAHNMAKYLIPMTAVQTIYDAAAYGMLQSLRAANDLNIPSFIKIGTLWLGVLIAFLLGFHSSMDIYGIGAGLMLGVAFGALMILPRFLVGTMKENLEIENKPQALLPIPKEKKKCFLFSFFSDNQFMDSKSTSMPSYSNQV